MQLAQVLLITRPILPYYPQSARRLSFPVYPRAVSEAGSTRPPRAVRSLVSPTAPNGTVTLIALHHQSPTLDVKLLGAYSPGIELVFQFGVGARFPEVYLALCKIYSSPHLFASAYYYLASVACF